MNMGNSTTDRASVSIDMGVVRLWNRWLERRWSAFRGVSTELILPSHAVECLTRNSPEYHIDYGGKPLAATDLDGTSWSEAYTAHGASLHLQQTGPDIIVHLETFLPHTLPGLVRQLRITNTGAAPKAITRVAADILPLDPNRFERTRPPTEDSTWVNLGDSSLYHRALEEEGGTLYLGSPDATGFAMFSPNPTYCAPYWTGNVDLAPGKTRVFPPMSLYWSRKGTQESLQAALNVFYAAWQEHIEPAHPDKTLAHTRTISRTTPPPPDGTAN